MLADQDIMAFVPTTDPVRGRAFYEGVLGLKVTDEDPYGIMFDANGTRLRMSVVGELVPAPYTILSWVVKDVRSVVRALQGKGVAFERYGFMEQDEWGVWRSPEGAQIAWFKDPDGNTLSVAEL
ncbi:MAG TPA: VOC family protein [Puia sp.]|nr:VOC family protein [Puia sp.]